MTRVEVYVVPRSKRPGPDGRHGELPRLRLASPPADGRANAEAERLLSSIVGATATLRSGARSRRKSFDVDLDAGSLAKRLAKAFGPENGGPA